MAYSVLPIAGVDLETITPESFEYTNGTTLIGIPSFGPLGSQTLVLTVSVMYSLKPLALLPLAQPQSVLMRRPLPLLAVVVRMLLLLSQWYRVTMAGLVLLASNQKL